MADDALTRAQSGQSLTNYPAIYEGFLAKGLPEDAIQPRVNVLTFHAWRALGRTVRRGEHGVRVLTWISTASETADDGTVTPGHRFPKSSTVFHVSQTEEMTR